MTDKKEEAKEEKEEAAPKQKKPSPIATSSGRPTHHAFAGTTLHKKVSDTFKQPGSKGHVAWEAIEEGMKFEDYVATGNIFNPIRVHAELGLLEARKDGKPIIIQMAPEEEIERMLAKSRAVTEKKENPPKEKEDKAESKKEGKEKKEDPKK